MVAGKAHSWPLMHNNITRSDLNSLINFLQLDNPQLTHGPKVREFEAHWSEWVGVRNSVMVNSGSSANDLTLLALREIYGPGKILLSPLGWVSDVSAVLKAGFLPSFVDIDPITLAASEAEVLSQLDAHTRGLLLVHILGLPGLTREILSSCKTAGVPIIEDVCESHGAEFEGRRCGSIGFASNFSFYYAHHLTTIEGGAVCSDDEDFLDVVRMLRSHGMVRESTNPKRRQTFAAQYPDLNPDFIFAYASHNNRPTELNGVLGLSQLPRLDANVKARRRTFRRFMEQLDPNRYRNWYDVDSSSNYAFIIVLAEPDLGRRDKVEVALRENGIEFRRGLSGGGNQVRQPYLRGLIPDLDPKRFPHAEHVHNYAWYVGNYPGIQDSDVDRLCELLHTI